MKKYMLFGAGYFGNEALAEYGAEKIECFLDNDGSKKNQNVQGIPIRLFSENVDEALKHHIVICTKFFDEIIDQLEKSKITDYEIYHEIIERKSYYSHKILIENPYEKDTGRDLTELEWIEKNDGNARKGSINRKVSQYIKQGHLFHHVEIETINRCNGTCSFCPINALIDPREKKVMSDELFHKIIDELAELNYSGRLALFSNNEPLLDSRIIEFHKYARQKLPYARMHLYTNGTLLNFDKFLVLLEILDELIIDNYQQDLKLIPISKMIVKYANEHPEIKKKVTIVLRKPNEILTSRGGDAPNRTQVNIQKHISCIYPFQQMVIRPDGKASLCCNDPLGKCTLGDVSKNKLVDVWNGEMYNKVRQSIKEGRENFGHCKNCDTFVLD